MLYGLITIFASNVYHLSYNLNVYSFINVFIHLRGDSDKFIESEIVFKLIWLQQLIIKIVSHVWRDQQDLHQCLL